MFAQRQFLVFLLCGGTSALVNIGSRWLFNLVFGYRTSIVLAFFVGLTTSFLLFKYVVFKVRQSGTVREGLYFLLVNAVTLTQTLLVSIGLAEYCFPWLGFTWQAATIAHTIGVGLPAFCSYWGHKNLTFGRKTSGAGKDSVQ